MQLGRENEPLEIVLLPEVLRIMAFSDRVLSKPESSLLLIGRSGVGRHTVIKLLSVLHRTRVFTPYPGKTYGKKQFMQDLKMVFLKNGIYFKNHILMLHLLICLKAMNVAGVEGDSVYFILEEHHFTDPIFYAVVDSLLASGEVFHHNNCRNC